MLDAEELRRHLSADPGPHRRRHRPTRRQPVGPVQLLQPLGHGDPERGDVVAVDLERRPQPPGCLRHFGAELSVQDRGQPLRRQRVQAGAEQRLHLLRGHRIAGRQTVDPVHPGTHPPAGGFALGRVVVGQPDMPFVGGIQRRHLPRQIVVP